MAKTDPPPVAPEPEAPEPEAHGEVAPKVGIVTRVKTQAADVKGRAEVYREDLEGRRSSNRVIDTVFGTYYHESSIGGALLAGAVAFRFFIFVVPYVFVLVFGFGLSATAAGEDPADVARRTGIVGLAAHAIEAGNEASTFAKIVTLGVATYALISGSRTMVKALIVVHALTWRVPLVKIKGLIKMAFMAIALFTGMLFIELVINKIHYESVAIWVVATALFVLVPSGVWLWATVKVFPSAPGVTWRDLWIGALVFGVGTQGLHIITVLWLSRSFSSKSETYGALGGALTILLWAYILGRLVTASASVSAVMWYTNHPPESPVPTSTDLLTASMGNPVVQSPDPVPPPVSSADT